MPCPLLRSTATYYPDDGPCLSVSPRWKTKALAAASLTLEALGVDEPGGRLMVSTSVPPMRGFGSSTLDVLASIRAVADSLGRQLAPADMADIAVTSETASDPLMFDDECMLFAHRDGVPLESFRADDLFLGVLGFGTDPSCRGIDTLAMPPVVHTPDELDRYEWLLELARRAFAVEDLDTLGRVATESSLLNQRILPKPLLTDVVDLALHAGALGVQVAHSGDIAGLLFDVRARDLEQHVRCAARGLTELGFASPWFFVAPVGGVDPARSNRGAWQDAASRIVECSDGAIAAGPLESTLGIPVDR